MKEKALLEIEYIRDNPECCNGMKYIILTENLETKGNICFYCGIESKATGRRTLLESKVEGGFNVFYRDGVEIKRIKNE